MRNLVPFKSKTSLKFCPGNKVIEVKGLDNESIFLTPDETKELINYLFKSETHNFEKMQKPRKNKNIIYCESSAFWNRKTS